MGKWLAKVLIRDFIWWIFFRHHTPHTNATFFRHATRQMRPIEQRPWRWHWLPGYQRALIKLGVFVGVPLALAWWFTHPGLHVAAALVVGVPGAGVSGWSYLRAAERRKHRKEVVEPLHGALTRIIGDGSPRKPEEWLTVPLDYQAETTSGVLLRLPEDRSWPTELRKAVQEAVSQKLGVPDLDVFWQTAGHEPTVRFRPVPQAPRKVGFRDVAEAMRKAPDTAPVLGMGKFGSIIDADLEADSPHILISAGSGGGKSVLAKMVIAQALNRGARVVILDRKRISHRWAKDLPGVEYHRDTDEIHDALVRLAKEGDRRNRLTDDTDDVDLGGRIFVVFEEMNATTAKLRNYWAEIRGKEDPKRSTALEALADLVNMGRQVQIHVVSIGQMLTANTLGGSEVRESFGTRCLTRYTVQAWKMLAGDVWPAPKRSAVKGRWQVVKHGEATETQVAFLTDSEARDWAMAGVCPSVHTPSDLPDKGFGTQGWDNRDGAVLVDLKGMFGVDYERRRKQLQRDPRAPRPVHKAVNGADLFRRVELEAWLNPLAGDGRGVRDRVRLVKTEGVAS